MLFLKLGALLAWLCAIIGTARLAIALWIATSFQSQEAMVAASRRYLATENTGEVIDSSIYLLAFGIILGVLVKFAREEKT